MKCPFALRTNPSAGRVLIPASLCFLLLLAQALGPTNCWADPPPNDECAGVITIPSTGPFPYLTEPLDITEATVSPADPLPINTNDPTAYVSVITKSVWFKFTPAVTALYTISTCVDEGAGTSVADTVMALFTSANGCSGPFVQKGDVGDEQCGPGDSQASLTQQLEANSTCFIVVWKYCDNCTDDGLNDLQLVVKRSVAPPNDTCAAATPVLLNLPTTGTTQGAVNNYQLADTNCFAGLGQTPSDAPGRDVVYSFTAPQADTYSFKVNDYDLNQDLVLYVAPSCVSGAGVLTVGNCLGAANRSQVNGTEEIVCLPLSAAQKVFIYVDDHTPGNLGSRFTLTVTRCVREQETNDSPATAGRLACGLEGSIFPATDVDYYALGKFPADWRAFVMIDGDSADNRDLELRITTATRTLEYDDNDNDLPFADSSPNIAGTPLTGEAAFVAVKYVDNLREAEPYRVYAVVQPPLASAAKEIEPNDFEFQAKPAPQNYFLGTLPGPSPSTDVDNYTFQARAGDLIFLSLDGDPYRTNSPINARLELLDSTGVPLVVVDDDNFRSTLADGSNTAPNSPAEALVYRAPVGGTYYARVSVSPRALADSGAGDYLLSISLNCTFGSLATNHPPAFTNLTITSPILGGSNTTLTGFIWEPDTGDACALVVDWGDGITNLVQFPAPGLLYFTLPHLYYSARTNATVSLAVRDLNGGSAAASLPVVIQPAAARFSSITQLPTGAISLRLTGSPHGVYLIQKQDPPGTWSTLETRTADDAGLFQFEDAPPAPDVTRFYRALAAP